jgi:hypothetical protein
MDVGSETITLGGCGLLHFGLHSQHGHGSWICASSGAHHRRYRALSTLRVAFCFVLASLKCVFYLTCNLMKYVGLVDFWDCNGEEN